MGKKATKATYTRFIYSIIDFFATKTDLCFDVSTYVENCEALSSRFMKLKINNFIERNKSSSTSNRYIIALSFNDEKLDCKGRELLKKIADVVNYEFLDSKCIEILKAIEPDAKVQVLSTHNRSSLTDYVIAIFYVSEDSSIECVISTDTITSKLIERGEDGEAVEFNTVLHSNLKSFKSNL